MNRTIFKLQLLISSSTFFHRQSFHRRLIHIKMFLMFSRFLRFQMFLSVVNNYSKTSEKSFSMMRNLHSRHFQSLLFHRLKFFLNFKIALKKLSILFIQLFSNFENVSEKFSRQFRKQNLIHLLIIN